MIKRPVALFCICNFRLQQYFQVKDHKCIYLEVLSLNLQIPIINSSIRAQVCVHTHAHTYVYVCMYVCIHVCVKGIHSPSPSSLVHFCFPRQKNDKIYNIVDIIVILYHWFIIVTLVICLNYVRQRVT